MELPILALKGATDLQAQAKFSVLQLHGRTEHNTSVTSNFQKHFNSVSFDHGSFSTAVFIIRGVSLFLFYVEVLSFVSCKFETYKERNVDKKRQN